MSRETILAAYRLLRTIETHPKELTASFLRKAASSDKTRDYVGKVPPEDLEQRVFEIYQHLGQWLQNKSEPDIARRYTEIGKLRVQQGALLTELIWTIVLVKATLLDFLEVETKNATPHEIFGQLELFQLFEQFFDRAVYYAVKGYEDAMRGGVAAAV